MIYPQTKITKRFFGLCIVCLAIESTVLFNLMPYPPDTLLLNVLVGVFLIFGVDGLLALSFDAPRIRRNLPASAAISRTFPLQYTLTSNQTKPTHCQISDHLPNEFQPSERTLETILKANQTTTITHAIRPTHRGNYHWHQIDVNLSSPLGFWWRRFSINESVSVKIYPDFKVIQSVLTFSHANLGNRFGIRRIRKRGSGQTFHQLREYHQGDSLKQVDWKASSRHHRLISKDYQEERDQHIVLALDCGRRMRAHDSDISHFDQTLNAILMLAFSAFRQGDSISMFTFAGEQRHITGLKGVSAINALLNTIYDLQPTNNASDYLSALSSLGDRLRKRSLIVVTTAFRAESLHDLHNAILNLQQRHHVAIANIMDSSITQANRLAIEHNRQADQYLGTVMYQEELNNGATMIQRSGCNILHATPQTLGPKLIQHYHALKCAGKL